MHIDKLQQQIKAFIFFFILPNQLRTDCCSASYHFYDPLSLQIGEMDDFTGLIGDKMEEELASVPLPEELMASGDGDRILTSPQQ